jgi:chemotaxis protein MotB
MSTMPPIIIIKKKGGHGGHHGGAWKVAYADFVTAMMALFIVLWLMNSSKPIQEAVGGYFKDPSGTAIKPGTNMRGSGESLNISKDNMQELKEALQNSLRQVPNIDKLKNHIEMTVTPEGLRIDLLESATSTFFNSGSAEPSIDGKDILTSLAKELGNLPNKIAIEGHTDSKPYAQRANYGNWELSTDRANAARRSMQQSGLGENQVMQVRGFANQRLRKPDAPLDPSNRRVSLIVEYLDKTAGTDKAELDKIKEGTAAPETQPVKASTSESSEKVSSSFRTK